MVYAMNGQPLPLIHGGPVRLIIRGGRARCRAKWLTRIWIRDQEHDGPGMTGTSYRVAVKPMVPGDTPDAQFPGCRIDAGTLDHHQSDVRAEFVAVHARGESARRRVGRR